PDEVVAAISKGNQITPSGNVTIQGKSPIVPVNSVVGADIKELEKIPIRLGTDPTVYVGDVGQVVDATDVPTGYGLVNGKRSVYILVTKRADASTVSVVNEVRANLPRMQAGIPVDEATVEVENIHTQYEHTPNVARAVRRGNAQTAVPRLLAMLCVLAVFLPSFFMQGAAKALFVPLALAVGYSMVASYVLSSTFVPVLSTW